MKKLLIVLVGLLMLQGCGQPPKDNDMSFINCKKDIGSIIDYDFRERFICEDDEGNTWSLTKIKDKESEDI
jgi:hypothetical protein